MAWEVQRDLQLALVREAVLVSNVRVAFRFEVYHDECTYLQSRILSPEQQPPDPLHPLSPQHAMVGMVIRRAMLTPDEEQRLAAALLHREKQKPRSKL